MNDLRTWRDILQARGIKVTNFKGWCLDADGSTWTIDYETLFRDGEPISKKQLKEYLKTKPLTLIAS